MIKDLAAIAVVGLVSWAIIVRTKMLREAILPADVAAMI